MEQKKDVEMNEKSKDNTKKDLDLQTFELIIGKNRWHLPSIVGALAIVQIITLYIYAVKGHSYTGHMTLTLLPTYIFLILNVSFMTGTDDRMQAELVNVGRKKQNRNEFAMNRDFMQAESVCNRDFAKKFLVFLPAVVAASLAGDFTHENLSWLIPLGLLLAAVAFLTLDGYTHRIHWWVDTRERVRDYLQEYQKLKNSVEYEDDDDANRTLLS